ncbi:hypothetical protein RJ640_002070 [Escallonia rubra]|uniref:RING-type domain-containing protein n=1 Tax=Escallonia rubra TaxID=112253 RepID=A0AA88RFN9_9ASTE|nr:hypothetical protein RJ640_002056 [Escallonia rubra]KAK2994877.1 hypothetical protein RJ640_002070 [Escallonia rubra]
MEGRGSRRGFGFGNSTTVVERGSFGSTSMSRDDIEKLPCFDFMGKEKGIGSPVDCAVCLENFNVGDKCRSLPLCDHSFHAQCVDSWLLRAALCPLCRSSADSCRRGSISGIGSSRFSESVIEFGEYQTTDSGHLTSETALELIDGQTADTSVEFIEIEVRERQTVESGTATELGNCHTVECGHMSDTDTAFSESQIAESGHLGETAIKLRDGETAESCHLSSNNIELGENQELKESRENRPAENGHMGETTTDLSEGQRAECGNSSESGMDLKVSQVEIDFRERQTAENEHSNETATNLVMINQKDVAI